MKLSAAKKCLLAATSIFLLGQSYAVDDSKKIEVTEDSFNCLTDMTSVGDFFVANLLDDLDATVAAGESETGAVYPAGSVVSLVPFEVMVKHQEGWNPETNDWEFFELTVSAEGSSIKTRGTTEVVNQFGGNCFGCHTLARPEWDLICGTGHGCAPLPLTREQIVGVQNSDPRCKKED